MKKDKFRNELMELVLKYRKETQVEVSEDSMLKEIGLDSICFLNLFVELETTYNANIDSIFVDAFQSYTVGQFIEAVMEAIE